MFKMYCYGMEKLKITEASSIFLLILKQHLWDTINTTYAIIYLFLFIKCISFSSHSELQKIYRILKYYDICIWFTEKFMPLLMIYDLILYNIVKVNIKNPNVFQKYSIVLSTFSFSLRIIKGKNPINTGLERFFWSFVHSMYIEMLVDIDIGLKACKQFCRYTN